MSGEIEQLPRQATPAPPGPQPREERWRPAGVEVFAALFVAAVVLRPQYAASLDGPALQTWSTIFVSITVQALPFLVLGVVVSGVIAAFVPATAVARFMPRGSLLAVPAAGLAGAALPGCECGSVPIAGRLAARGASPAAALAFMLAAPAINPVVMVATAVAFPGRPAVVLARFAASLAVAIIVGFVWQRFGDDELLEDRGQSPEPAHRWTHFGQVATHDLVHAGGWLVVGAMAAAALQVVVPRSLLDAVASDPLLAVAALSVLAVVLAICSEADAFIAVGLSQFSLTARLAFLVVGPVVDVKLIALHAGVFGRRFALRFAPLAFLTAVVCALAVSMAAYALTGDIAWVRGRPLP